MLDQSPITMTMGSRYLALISQITGSFSTPRLISQLFKSPVWSPEKITFHTTVMATPAVILGEYRISANTVLKPLVRLHSAHARIKDST